MVHVRQWTAWTTTKTLADRGVDADSQMGQLSANVRESDIGINPAADISVAEEKSCAKLAALESGRCLFKLTVSGAPRYQDATEALILHN